MFAVLVSLTFSLPSLFNGEGPAPLPSCNIQDNHILRLMFLAHITQIIFSVCPDWPEHVQKDLTHSPPDKECSALLDLVEVVVKARRSDQDAESVQDPRSVNASALWQVVMEQSLGFLRCAALFYHYLSGVTYPPELTSLLPPDLEFISLAKYLALPYSPKHLLDSPFTLQLTRNWSNHPNVELRPSKMDFTTTVPRLIRLPEDYSELINNISNFSCPRSVGEESRTPCMCLVCGKVVCSQSFCCQTELDGQSVGACAAHTLTCGAGNDDKIILLLINDYKLN